MAEKKQTKKVQKKKKKWVKIKAPSIFRDSILGETPVYEPENLIGRKIKVNLMSILRDPKKQNYNVVFRISTVKEGVAVAETHGFKMVSAYLKRLVKRRKNKVDDSFVVKDKQGKLVRIKPIVIMNGKSNKSVMSAIRQKVKYLLALKFEKITFEEYISELISVRHFKFKDELKKIYPIKVFEIRSIHLETKKVEPIKASDFSKIKKKVVKNKSQEIIEEKDSQSDSEKNRSNDSSQDISDDSQKTSDVKAKKATPKPKEKESEA